MEDDDTTPLGMDSNGELVETSDDYFGDITEADFADEPAPTTDAPRRRRGLRVIFH